MSQGLISGVEREWLTLKEASELTGKSLNSLRLLVHRKKVDRVRKITDNGRNYWLIHRDSVGTLGNRISADEAAPEIDISSFDEKDFSDAYPEEMACRFAAVPLEHYEQQRKDWLEERDGLMQGIMMYRFKFEELEKQIKLLPAPPQVMSEELKWKDNRLLEAQQKAHENDNALAEAQRMMEEMQRSFDEERQLRDKIEADTRAELERERRRSWWKKLLGIR